MKFVNVTYTTSESFSRTNQENIQAIVSELKRGNFPGISYNAYLLPDGKTFIHVDQFDSEKSHQVLQSLESFKKFSMDLWGSNLEKEPVLYLPDLIASYPA